MKLLTRRKATTMSKVFVINGSPLGGKDTFINFVKTYYEDTLNFSSVDYIKWLSHKHLGINVKNKNEKLRQFLSEFKRILTEYNDFPYQQCKMAIESLEENQVLFLHIREKEEIEKVKRDFPNVKVVFVEGKDECKSYGNKSDDLVKEIEADIIIHNDSTLAELSKTAKWFTQTYILGE